MSDPSRIVAFDVIRAVSDRDSYVNLLLPTMLRERGISGRDAAFATELAHGTIRRRGTYDAILDRAVGKGLRSVDEPVADVLRLGTHQLLSMRVPAHAAVSTSVELVRRRVGHKPANFVNAVLRKVASRDIEAWLAIVTEGRSQAEALSIEHSHPAWIVEAFTAALGARAGELAELLAADNLAPKVTLVARPGLVDPDELHGTVPGHWSPFARVLESGDPGDIAAIRDGRAGVQDEGSQLVALALADAPLEGRDERWLDLCAGPGGKAALLAALGAARGVHLTANEPQHHRAELVTHALTALDNVDVTEHDGRHGPWETDSFDRVLVDAPCTGLGALRRRPESRWRRQPADLEQLVPLQAALLDRALELVRPGGVVAYATCSPHRAETVEIVDAALSTHPGLEQVALPASMPESGERMQLWPHQHGTDAMFAALLRKPGHG